MHHGQLVYAEWMAVNRHAGDALLQGGYPYQWTNNQIRDGSIRLPVQQQATETPPLSSPTTHAALPPAQTIAVRLDMSFLFEFDGHTLEQMLPSARAELDRFVQRLHERSLKLGTIQIEGHADRLGPVSHNRWLALQRAQTVKAYLEQKGIQAQMWARGLQSADASTHCRVGSLAQMVACLQPDRRVDVRVNEGIGNQVGDQRGEGPDVPLHTRRFE